MSAVHDSLAIENSRRLSDEVYLRLRDAIIAGRFPLGARMLQRELSDYLKVSRTPIREAIKQLEQEGLIVNYPNKGWFVRNPSFDEARQAYEMRGIAEAVAAEFATSRATDDELRQMQAVVEKGAAANKGGDRDVILFLNNEFHRLQCQAARNVFLEEHLRRLWAYVDLLRGQHWTASGRASSAQDEHEEIMDALLTRNAAKARMLSEQHVQMAWAFVASSMEERSRSNVVQMFVSEPDDEEIF